jgi:hypothetical protein
VLPDSVGVVKVGDVDNTLLPLPVDEVTPVPPFATAKVPARLIAPEVAEVGVKPVEPPAKVVTPVVAVNNVAEDGIFVPFTEVVELRAVGMSAAESVVPEVTRPLRSVVTFV